MALFDSLRRFFSKSDTAAPVHQSAKREVASQGKPTANESSPVSVDTGITRFQGNSFVANESVLGRNEQIIAHEFRLANAIQSRLSGGKSLAWSAYEDGFLRNLRLIDMVYLIEHRLAFIHLSQAALKNALIELLPRKNVVIVLSMDNKYTPGSLAGSIKLVAQMGFEVGLLLRHDLQELPTEFMEVNYLEVDASTCDGLQLKSLAGEIRTLRNTHQVPIKLIARNLQTDDDFRFCHQCGYDYFLGNFLSCRDDWHPPKGEINRIRILEILNLIRSGCEFAEIADTLKTEPILTYKLLRYINSVGNGLQSEVTTIAQALVMLGRDRFYRWLSLLLFDFGKRGYKERVLSEQALTRGRFMELLAGQGNISQPADHLFMTGIFSLLDVLLRQPMETILRNANLPAPVRCALVEKNGPLHDVLELACAVEANDTDTVVRLADCCNIDGTLAGKTSILAIAWGRNLSGAD